MQPRHSQPDPAGPKPGDRTGYLHIFALSSLAVAQPLFDLLARNAEFFVVRRSSTAEILALVAVVLVLLPLPLAALVALARRWTPRLGALVHGAVLALLAALLVLLALTRSLLLDGPAWLAAGLAAGCAFAWAYRRFAALRLLNTYLALALVAVPVLFFLNPRIRKITFGHETEAALHTTGASTPVVFLLFDELSLTALLDENRQVDPVSYPNLAAFAREATWFANATTVSDATELAVPALVTGNLPERDLLPIVEDHPHNLFTIFGGDYRIWAMEPITRLCPAAVNTAAGGRAPPAASSLKSLFSDLWVVYQHLLLPPGFATHLPVISDRWQNFGGSAVETTAPGGDEPRPEASDFSQAAIVALSHDRREKLDRFVDALDPGADQALYFLHVLLPHTPWEYLPSGKTYPAQVDRIPGLENEKWQDDEALVRQAYQRYLLQVQFLDRWFGELVGRLRQLDLYDRSLIVFSADHGVSFRPGDSRRFLTETNAPDLIPVPLIVKEPRQRRGRVVEHPVSTIDVLPTILELVDVDSPWPLDGRSALAGKDLGAGARVVGKYGDFEIDERLHRDKYATLDWKLDTFGRGSALLQAGTHPELYGRKLDEVGWQEQDRVALYLKGESLFHRYAAEAALSPAFVSGVLETDATDTECCDLAVAVNGTLYATVRTFGSPPDDLQFTALVPDAAFTEGQNRVEVFRVRRGAPEPELELLGASGQTSYALDEDAGQRVTAVRQGTRTVPVRAGALRGYFSTERLPEKLRITGWAVDVEAESAPERVLVFHRGEMVFSGLTTKVRHDVSAELGWSVPVRSAFQFDLPYTRVPELGRLGLRLFALSRDAASELGFFYVPERDEGGRVERIRVTSGREIPVPGAALAGALEEVRPEQGRIRVHGWAADVVHREPPERILVFAGDRAIYDSRAFQSRQDVARKHGLPESLEVGFDHDVAAASSTDPLLVFAVSQRGEAARLHTLPFSYTLEKNGDGSVAWIGINGSAEIPVVAGALTGFVDKMEPTAGGTLRLGGWAVDEANREPPEKVLVFAGGELVHESFSFFDREDVARELAAPELAACGFEHELPSAAAGEIVVVALSRRGKATLLPILAQASSGRAK